MTSLAWNKIKLCLKKKKPNYYYQEIETLLKKKDTGQTEHMKNKCLKSGQGI